MKKSTIGKSIVIFALLALAVFSVLALSSCSQHTHSYTNMSILQVATCNEVGVQRAACSCGDFQIREMPKTEHTEGEWKPLYEATCITGGSKQLFCKICNEVMKTESVSSLGHDIISYEKREPNCAVEGYEAYEACTRCSYTTYKAIDKLPHTVEPNTKYPTCTEPLLCTECEGVVEPATGHIEIVTTGFEATCTKEGKTDYIECLSCKLVLQESIKIPKRAHTVTGDYDLPGSASTCSAMGQTRSQKCKDCGEEIIKATLISKLPHTYGKDNKCTKCGNTREGKCAHSRTEPIPSVAATCSNFGATKGVKCVNCGEVITAQKVVGKGGKQITSVENQTLENLPEHKIEKLPAVAPTPTTPGLTEGQRCTECKVILVQQDILPALSRTGKTE